ncbi:MAG TPA: DUF1552 domain-containing protein [Lacipirellulaceae bacterium]|nr:DUF1552 domain-containing protein [Lacipirellulaceae bacterium]
MTRRLSRRTVLRGAGAALALPWLEAMAPRLARGAVTGSSQSGAAGPVRIAALFFPNGVRQDRWTPETAGYDWTPPPQLEPLASCRADVSVVSGLWHEATNSGDGHYVKDAAWLTGTTIRKTTGVDLNSGGVSMDQVAAATLGRHTPLPSLELGGEPVRSGVDSNVGYTRVYGAHIAWREPTQPLAKEIDPRLVFDRMTAVASGKPLGRSNRPVLDVVADDARRLRRTLGEHDRHRLDEYLESVDALESRLARLEQPSATPWRSRVDFATRSRPPQSPDDHAERTRLMLDMIALAFESDVTRVITFMFGNSVSNANFTFLEGVESSHHEVSHHGDKTSMLEQYERITTWHVAQFAYLLNKLRSLPEGDSTVLDNSAILFGSGFRDGNSHNPHDLPLVLAGRAGGRLAPGQHVRCTRDNPMANLLLTMLRAADVATPRFADSTGVIDQLLA